MKFSTGEAAVTRSETKTPRDKEARVGWMRRRRRGERDEWCQGRRIGRDETGFALLITRRSQVQILPPLPTRQRYNRRSTARKLSLRAVVVSGEGVRSDQIAGHNRLGCPAASQFDEMHRDI